MPGGQVEEGESLIEAAIRETKVIDDKTAIELNGAIGEFKQKFLGK